NWELSIDQILPILEYQTRYSTAISHSDGDVMNDFQQTIAGDRAQHTMMNRFVPLDGLELYRFDVAVFRQARIRQNVSPLIWSLGRNRYILRHLNDQVWRTNGPFI